MDIFQILLQQEALRDERTAWISRWIHPGRVLFLVALRLDRRLIVHDWLALLATNLFRSRLIGESDAADHVRPEVA